MLTRIQRVRLRDEMREKLASYHFTHFVTLVTNAKEVSEDRMRSPLKKWDAWTNRRLNGPQWQKRPEQRLVWFEHYNAVHPHRALGYRSPREFIADQIAT